MIETFTHRDRIVSAVRQDVVKTPVKPTVMGEPHYEGVLGKARAGAIHIRRQAWQSFFAGACGFTYGGSFDEEGNGPLFSPANNWKHLLANPGAGQMIHLRSFLEKHAWYTWEWSPHIFRGATGEGELKKLAVTVADKALIYFPDHTSCDVVVSGGTYYWYNTANGSFTDRKAIQGKFFQPPAGWEDGVLVIEQR